MRYSRRLTRLATFLWFALTVVVWNGVFDYEIKSAARLYLFKLNLHTSGRGPAVGIDEIMRPASTHGALVASLWAVAVAAAGVGVMRLAARYDRLT
jgi:hypothetical protein